MPPVQMRARSASLPLLLALLLSTVSGAEDVLPGWKGESYQPGHVFPHVAGDESVQDVRGNGLLNKNASKPWVEAVAWKPRAFVYHNFLSAEECDHIVNVAKPLMRRSTVLGQDRKAKVDEIRTSYGTFLRRGRDPVISRVERRLADWTHLPVVHQEDMQILHYGIGQKYGAHYDSLVEESPRVATVLIYLRDTPDGGETAFPEGSVWADDAMPERFQKDGEFSECARGHVAVKPKKGSALLFYSLQLDAKKQDLASMHTGCPVVSGTKWSATKWIHTNPFRPETYTPGHVAEEAVPQPEICEDLESRCSEWKEAGECEKNSGYMVGDGFQMGHCRHICGICEKCDTGNAACKRRNRIAAGFLPLEEEN